MDDGNLLNAIQDLDPKALVATFDQYASALYKYALRLTGNPAEADDIVGEVFWELLTHLKEGNGPHQNLRSYLYQVAYHKVVDHARERDHLSPLEEAESLKSTESISSRQEDREQIALLDSVIRNHLSEDQRHVIILRYIEDFSLAETAEIIGKKMNNIKIIQKRALARLRRVMEIDNKD